MKGVFQVMRMLRMIPRLFLSFLLIAFQARAGDFRVGAAKVEITPKDGTPLGGFYKFRGSDGGWIRWCLKKTARMRPSWCWISRAR